MYARARYAGSDELAVERTGEEEVEKDVQAETTGEALATLFAQVDIGATLQSAAVADVCDAVERLLKVQAGGSCISDEQRQRIRTDGIALWCASS
jgi:hypothetical protein